MITNMIGCSRRQDIKYQSMIMLMPSPWLVKSLNNKVKILEEIQCRTKWEVEMLKISLQRGKKTELCLDNKLSIMDLVLITAMQVWQKYAMPLQRKDLQSP